MLVFKKVNIFRTYPIPHAFWSGATTLRETRENRPPLFNEKQPAFFKLIGVYDYKSLVKCGIFVKRGKKKRQP